MKFTEVVIQMQIEIGNENLQAYLGNITNWVGRLRTAIVTLNKRQKGRGVSTGNSGEKI